ncbi:MAG: hypothetical protein EB079_00245 [Verrucomicrobia bacterium]|nr:hypothetical protein [Verrucomicrobiota bacterium]
MLRLETPLLFLVYLNERVVSVEELQILIDNAIENEEYEIAAELRDRIQMLETPKKEVKKKKKK